MKPNQFSSLPPTESPFHMAVLTSIAYKPKPISLQRQVGTQTRSIPLRDIDEIAAGQENWDVTGEGW